MKHHLLSEAPIHGISPLAAVERGLRKTFRYSGRASKSEYWWAATAYFVATVPFVVRDVYAQRHKQVAEKARQENAADEELAEIFGTEEMQLDYAAVDSSTGYKPSPLTWVVGGLFTVPLVSLKVRRLHDSSISGKWLPLIDFFPASSYFYSRNSRVAGARFDKSR